MKKHLFIGAICLIFGGFASVYALPSKIEYKNVEVKTAPPTQTEIIEQVTKSIYDSDKFQQEMRETAKARALYQLSIEQQDNAVHLSEMAVKANGNSQLLADDWMYQHSSTTDTDVSKNKTRQ